MARTVPANSRTEELLPLRHQLLGGDLGEAREHGQHQGVVRAADRHVRHGEQQTERAGQGPVQ